MYKKDLPPEDDKVLKRLASGDEQAFREIYNRYGKRVYHAALRYLKSRELALDVVQEIFFMLWEKREHFLHINSLEGYLITSTQNHIYGLLRKWASEKRHYLEYSGFLEETIEDTDTLLRSNQYEEIVGQLVEKLPPQQKRIFTMSRELGMTHEAIASELNLSPGTVKNHMMKALQYLRKHLTPHVSFYLLLTTQSF